MAAAVLVAACSAPSDQTPSTENTAEQTTPGLRTPSGRTRPSECPTKVRMHSPLSTIHNLAVLSAEAVNTIVPSPENVAQSKSFAWPTKAWMHSPLSMLHRLAVSPEAVNTLAFSPEKTAEQILPPNVWTHAPLAMLHTLAAEPTHAVSTRVPSPEIAAKLT
jgi:hypothetical protein